MSEIPVYYNYEEINAELSRAKLHVALTSFLKLAARQFHVSNFGLTVLRNYTRMAGCGLDVNSSN